MVGWMSDARVFRGLLGLFGAEMIGGYGEVCE